MRKTRLTTILMSGSLVAGAFGSAAFAADVDTGALPAVSGFNGKFELGAGITDLDGIGSDELLRGGISLSMPVGDMFGLQADFAAVDAFNDTLVGGNLHFFTRDPNSYLLGVVGGAGFADDADIYYIGPEFELYVDNFTIEAWAGYLNIDFDNGGSDDEYFAQVDFAFYATENLRLTAGVSSIANFESVHAGMEWLVGDVGVPLALLADAEFGENDYMALTAGLKIYFGPESGKSLIRRHREDDPRNRGLDLFQRAGDGFAAPPAVTGGGGGEECDPEFDPECFAT